MDDDDEYTVPLQDQRVFGAGIKRKRIAFVPAAAAASPVEGSLPRPTSSAADRYLSIVLPKEQQQQTQQERPADSGIDTERKAETPQCAVCRQPVVAVAAAGDDRTVATTWHTTWHESSIAHQVCLEHSQPPSHLDRGHVGVKYLAAYGWDPDSRSGLGARGEGIRIPIKAREKNDTVGLRERVDDDEDDEDDEDDDGGGGVGESQKQKQKRKKETRKREEDRVVVRLNAKEVRKKEMAAKKRAEALRQVFYNSVDVDKYLGSGEN